MIDTNKPCQWFELKTYSAILAFLCLSGLSDD